MDLAKGAVGVGMWSCWGEELVESGVGFLSPQKLAAGDRSVGGCHYVRIWTYWNLLCSPPPAVTGPPDFGLILVSGKSC